jgi:hypothetical protein
MVGKGKHDRRGSGPWFYVAIVAVVFGLYSLVVAATTYDDCGDNPKEWIVFPPEWQCNTRSGFG